MNAKRVLFISMMEADPWGGSEELWAGAASNLASTGHTVLASVKRWSPPPRQLERLRAAGVTIIERRTKVFGVKMRNQIAHDIRRANPDLVIVSSGNATPSVRAAREIMDSGKPFAHIAQSNYEAWAPNDAQAPQLRTFFERARLAVFVSHANRRMLETQLATSLDNAAVVRNPNSMKREALPWPSGDTMRFACVGRLHTPSKGQDILIETLAQPAWGDRDWRLDIYGQGPHAGILADLVKLRGLENRIFFKGSTSDIEGVWREHHALLLASRYEGLPLVIPEAMLCGRIVVTTDIAGAPEIVEDGVSGFIACAPTARAFSQSLEAAWAARDRWRIMGQAAHARALQTSPLDAGAAFATMLLEAAC